MNRKKLKGFFALMMLMCFGAGMLVFIIAIDEQATLSSGRPEPARITLQELVSHGPGDNKHIELAGFYFGRQYVYTSKLAQFNEVYVPMFAKGQPEDASNLHLLLWIRNDRNSNQPLIQDQKHLDEFVEGLNRNPGSLSGVLHTVPARVRELTGEAYPGADTTSVQALWARDFPDQQSVDLAWGLMAVCLISGCVFFVAFRRQSRNK